MKVCLRAHSDVPQGSRDTLNILFGLPFRVAGKHFAAKHTDTQTQSRRELRRPSSRNHLHNSEINVELILIQQ